MPVSFLTSLGRRVLRVLVGHPRGRDAVRGLALGLAGVGGLQLGLRGAGLLAPQAEPGAGPFLELGAGVLAVAGGAALLEEMLFRGALFAAFGKGGRAIALTSALYALLHLGQFRAGLLQAALGLAGLFGLGLLLGALRARTGGILAGVGLHAGLVAAFLLGDRLHAWGGAAGAPGWLVGDGYPLAGLAGWLALGATALLARRIFPPA